ncbi:MAG TPA: D-arabinono-1,4-lactone oxidase [Actinomycetes bacterium]
MTRWTNWARTEVADPRQVVRPGDTGEVVAAVRDAVRRGLRVKPVGSGHSFTGAAVTDGVQVDLARMSGLLTTEGRLVTVGAGTTLRELNRLLASLGLALENLGDIDAQTVAGAIATGTHGTGARFGGLATQVHAVEVALADGSVATTSATERPDLFAAARVGLGALGVVTRVTLRCVPAFLLRAVERPLHWDEALDGLDDAAAEHDHVDAYWFPHTDVVQVKHNDRVGAPDGLPSQPRWRRWVDDELLSNVAYGAVNRMVSRRPSLVPGTMRSLVRLVTPREYVAPSYDVFVSPRRVVFRESEYAVPRAAVGDVLRELRRWVDSHDEPISFPVEVRFAAADDIWLSTAYDRESAYVAVHQYLRMPHEPWFAAFERIVASVGGRPHWGKLHSLGAEELRPLYPRFDDFRAVRDAVDPGRVFGNPYLERVLGS